MDTHCLHVCGSSHVWNMAPVHVSTQPTRSCIKDMWATMPVCPIMRAPVRKKLATRAAHRHVQTSCSTCPVCLGMCAGHAQYVLSNVHVRKRQVACPPTYPCAAQTQVAGSHGSLIPPARPAAWPIHPTAHPCCSFLLSPFGLIFLTFPNFTRFLKLLQLSYV